MYLQFVSFVPISLALGLALTDFVIMLFAIIIVTDIFTIAVLRFSYIREAFCLQHRIVPYLLYPL